MSDLKKKTNEEEKREKNDVDNVISLNDFPMMNFNAENQKSRNNDSKCNWPSLYYSSMSYQA